MSQLRWKWLVAVLLQTCVGIAASQQPLSRKSTGPAPQSPELDRMEFYKRKLAPFGISGFELDGSSQALTPSILRDPMMPFNVPLRSHGNPPKVYETELGGVGDGGGDPRAVHLLEFGKHIVRYNALFQDSAIDSHKVRDRLLSLSTSLDRPNPLIQFLATDDIECLGARKKACTLKNGSIIVAGNYWENSQVAPLDRCTLAVIEVLRPLEITRVYEKSREICYDYEKEISSQKKIRALSETPIPKISVLYVSSMNRNFDGSLEGLNEAELPEPGRHVQYPVDSPMNGDQNTWTDAISATDFYRVQFSEQPRHRGHFISRLLGYDGQLRVVRMVPKIIQFTGTISAHMGEQEFLFDKRGQSMNMSLQHGLWPTHCEVKGQFDFIQDPEIPQFYVYRGPSMNCLLGAEGPLRDLQGRLSISPLYGKIGFYVKQ